MVDVFTKEKRSWIMRQVRGRNTRPEIVVRSMVHRMGFRYRLHRGDLPGSPDLVLARYGKVIFVHGCFWHGHRACVRAKRPTTNEEFWNKKLGENVARDKRVRKQLHRNGWETLVVWQCETRQPELLLRKLTRFLNDRQTKEGTSSRP